MRNLLSQPKYTIDTSSILDMINADAKYDKGVFKKLWANFQNLCDTGQIISHIEVYKEIRVYNIKEHLVWTKSYKQIFRNYNLPRESDIIRDIGSKGGHFVDFIQQGKSKPVHADPWLVAQAKINNLILITEEKIDSPKRIPQICSEIGVKSINILELIKKEGWSY